MFLVATDSQEFQYNFLENRAFADHDKEEIEVR